MKISKKDRKILKAGLKFGDMAEISRISGKSVTTVKRWFNNEGDSIEIPKAIVFLEESREKTQKSLSKALEIILNKKENDQ